MQPGDWHQRMIQSNKEMNDQVINTQALYSQMREICFSVFKEFIEQQAAAIRPSIAVSFHGVGWINQRNAESIFGVDPRWLKKCRDNNSLVYAPVGRGYLYKVDGINELLDKLASEASAPQYEH